MMRDPYLIQEILFENDNKKSNIIKINDVPKFDIEDFDLLEPKQFTKYTNTIENICRTSFEYRQLINYLRDNMNMNKCAFFDNVTNADSYKIKIHVHHEPFTLYDIVKTVFNKRQALRESLSVNMVAQEVMYLHYTLLVGLIPLSETVHELVHGNYLFVPMNKVFGNINFFIERYEKYFDDELQLNLEKVKEYTKVYNQELYKNKRLLEKKYLYLNIENQQLPNYQDIIDKLNSRMDEVKHSQEQLHAVYKLGECDENNKKIIMIREVV